MTDQNPMRIAEEMRAKRAAATQGEWENTGSSLWCQGYEVATLYDQSNARDYRGCEENADFIAFAANNAIALADALEEAQRRIAELEAEVQHYVEQEAGESI